MTHPSFANVTFDPEFDFARAAGAASILYPTAMLPGGQASCRELYQRSGKCATGGMDDPARRGAIQLVSLARVLPWNGAREAPIGWPKDKQLT